MKRNGVYRTFADLEEQLAALCKKTRHRCWDWAQGPDSQLARWKRLPAQGELDVCSLGGEASERGGGCSLGMTGKHCWLSQRGMDSFCWYLLGVFPLSAVGLVTKKENDRCMLYWNDCGAYHPGWWAIWMAYFYLFLRLVPMSSSRSIHIYLASHALYTHITRIKACNVLLKK